MHTQLQAATSWRFAAAQHFGELVPARPIPAGRDIAALSQTAEIKLVHEKEVALALVISRFSGELGWVE